MDLRLPDNSTQVALIIGTAFFCLFLLVVIELIVRCVVIRQVGYQPIKIQVGGGPRIFRGRLDDMDLEIGLLAYVGGVGWVATGLKRWIFLTTLGPVLSLLFLALVWFIQTNASLPDLLLLSLRYVLAIGGFMLLVRLLPYEVWSGGKRISSEGKLIWMGLTMKPSTLNGFFLHHSRLLAKRLLERDRIPEAREAIVQAWRQFTDELQARLEWVRFLLNAGHDALAREECESLLDSDSSLERPRDEVLDGIASVPVFHKYPTMLPEAMDCIDQALKMAPEKITLVGTKGSLLVLAGALGEGITMLEEVRSKSESENDRAISTYFLALAFHLNGEGKKSAELLTMAQKTWPDCRARKRVEDEIAGKQTGPE